jgi:uncharacterized membrane protein
MKKLKLSATVNAILGILSALALILLYLTLSDIAGATGNSSLEWYIVGICMIILSVFTISSFITVVYTFKHLKTLKKEI